MPSILNLSFRKYKDIIKVYYTIIVQCVVKNIINIVLKYSQGIIKAKWGYQHFIKPKVGNKCYKLLMAFSNINPIKHGNNIKLYIKFCAIQGIKCLINKQEQISVFNSNIIKSFIVIADPHPSSQLGGEQKQGYSRGY